MKETAAHNAKYAKIVFAKVYPYYIKKVENKGRTITELHEVIEWLTGFDEKQLQKLIEDKVTFEEFFKKAKLHPKAKLITGVICGYRIEDIKNPLTRKARYLDKLVDELAKGKSMDSILRTYYIKKEVSTINSNFLHSTPPDIQQLLDTDTKLLSLWNSLTELGRNEWICWVTIVKKENIWRD
jgi:hypothetical protein